MNNRSEIFWAPRVSLYKIRELYLSEASGTADDDQVNEVAFSLYVRCKSILEFTEALEGRVLCKRCSAAGKETMIERKTKKPNELLRCPACGWQVRWKVYLAESEKVDGQLTAGHAGDAFRRYLMKYPQCATREEKLVAIDRLIHEFHWILLDNGKPSKPWKPAGVNLLRGSATQVIEMLNALSYGEHTPPELLEGRQWWLEQDSLPKRMGWAKPE